jgi:Peptidase family S41
MADAQETGIQGGHDLGAIHTMPEFRTVTEREAVTAADRDTLVAQAAALIDGLYVHLLQKRAMYAVEPSQRLRLLRHRLPQLTDAQFHTELLRIFVELRDLHTNYILPGLYQGPFAFLGILLEQYWDNGEPHWMVSKVFDRLTGDPQLVPGVDVTHWNGSPMALAVARNADREAGSNRAARTARGLENMTLRQLALSPSPDEDWVDLRYRAGSAVREARIPWRVFDSLADLRAAISGDAGTTPSGVAAPAAHLVGLDLRTELVRDVKKRLFAPAAVAEEHREAMADGAPPATPAQAAEGVITTTRPELKARKVTTTHGTFGHLRIYTFHMKDQNIEAFIDEVARLLSLMPRDGLIVDVRGNGGGYVIAAEFLLQFLTPRRIQSEPMQFITTRTIAELCAKVADLGQWSPSIEESIETGAQYSSALPLYPQEVVNSVGQLYHGPVVLVTDALCYSATDIFSAGFQDHEIGPVLGIDDNTGAGGANVWTQEDLVSNWPDGPFIQLPGGADFRVALRRSLRVGKRLGEPVEDLGVIPDVSYHLTSRDLLEDNPDLMEKAGELLAQGRPRTLDVEVSPRNREVVTLEATTAALTGLDIYANGRPAATASKVSDGVNTITVPLPDSPKISLRLEGFDNGNLVAARTLTLS